MFHIDGRLLLTGDTLHWNHRRGELDVFPSVVFHSWNALADTMDRLAVLRVEWILPGHGKWHNVGVDEWRSQMARLGPAMRSIGQQAWAERPNSGLRLVLSSWLADHANLRSGLFSD